MPTQVLCPKCHMPHPEGATCQALPVARRGGVRRGAMEPGERKPRKTQPDMGFPVRPRAAAFEPTEGVPEGAPVGSLAAATPEPPPPPEIVLGGRYRLEGRLGAGGMGEVYRATDLRLGKTVAVKRVVGLLADDPDIIRRFQSEIRATARVDHPNVVDILDKGEDDDGRPFFVLEHLEGKTLREVIQAEGRLPLERARRILDQLLKGLAKAHARNVIHRDLKPHNIMLLGEGAEDFVKILDFGIAKALDAATGPQTRHGQVLGTPAYMSPEVASARGGSHPTVDIYSLGVILYEMLAGVLPFGNSLEENLLARAERATPPPLSGKVPDLPAGIDALIARAMAPEPRDRFQSADDFRAALTANREPAVAVDVLEPGATIDGRYRVKKRVGEGGMAVVYLAEELHIGRACAVKFLFSEGASLHPQLRERFFQDAALAARIDHENVIRVFATGEWQGVPYIATEYVDGPTLREAWPSLDWAGFSRVVSDVAAALDRIHQEGIVHRDVSPENILLDPKGRARLVDFGIARPQGSLITKSSQGGMMAIGRYGYMAPEQAFDPRTASPRSDQFSLGAIVYEALAGLPPHVETDDPEGPEADPIIGERLLSKAPPRDPRERRPDVPERLVAVVLRALAYEPAARYASCAELAEALLPFSGAAVALPTSAQPEGTPALVPTPPNPPAGFLGKERNRWWLAGVLIAIIVVSTVLMVIGLVRRFS